ncbi:hypothetical protein [Ornithobacterium rhinotracheale]
MSTDFQGGWNEEEGVYYAKGSFDNEVEYYNEIICNTNFWDIYMGEILNNMYAGNHEEPLKILEEVKEVIFRQQRKHSKPRRLPRR